MDGRVVDQNAPSAVDVGVEDLRPAADLLRLWVPQADEWINSNMRLHRMVKANRVKAWRSAAAEAVPPGWSFHHPVRIVASIWKSRAGRYDPNNLAGTTKACVDGFVESGLLVDDDWNHVTGPDHRHGGKGEPGIIFLFEAVPQNVPQMVHFAVELRHVPPLRGGHEMEMSTMRLHSLQNCINLAEAVPIDRENFRVIGELLIELRHLAKVEEAAR